MFLMSEKYKFFQETFSSLDQSSIFLITYFLHLTFSILKLLKSLLIIFTQSVKQ